MEIKPIKNKKADVPITILVIMVVAICILAILSFVNSRNRVQSSPLGIELIEEINSDVEKFYFYLNLDGGFSKEEAAEKIGAEIIDGLLVITREKIIDGVKVIEVEYKKNV